MRIAALPLSDGIITREERVEEAILFVVKALGGRSRPGKKAVVLHSLRVGFFLMSLGFSEDIVIAGILHDVAEKTHHSPVALGRRFGGRVGRIVAAVTNNQQIHDTMLRYEDSIQRCLAYGEAALVVRAADLIDNFDRLTVTGSRRRLLRVTAKLKFLLKACRGKEIDTRIIAALRSRSRKSTYYLSGLAKTRGRLG